MPDWADLLDPFREPIVEFVVAHFQLGPEHRVTVTNVVDAVLKTYVDRPHWDLDKRIRSAKLGSVAAVREALELSGPPPRPGVIEIVGLRQQMLRHLCSRQQPKHHALLEDCLGFAIERLFEVSILAPETVPRLSWRWVIQVARREFIRCINEERGRPNDRADRLPEDDLPLSDLNRSILQKRLRGDSLKDIAAWLGNEAQGEVSTWQAFVRLEGIRRALLPDELEAFEALLAEAGVAPVPRKDAARYWREAVDHWLGAATVSDRDRWIVALHLAGRSNAEIASRFGVGERRVANILTLRKRFPWIGFWARPPRDDMLGLSDLEL